MRTLNICISEVEYNKFGLKKEKLSFEELLDIVSREFMRQKLLKSVQLAEEYGLSKMTKEEIDEEIKTARKMLKVIVDTNILVSSFN